MYTIHYACMHSTVYYVDMLTIFHTVQAANKQHKFTCINTVTDGLDPPVEHTDTMSSSNIAPVVYTIEQLSLQPTSLHAETLIL